MLRDPFGLPYIITLDINGDNRVFDYTLNQMYQKGAGNSGKYYTVPGNAIVWSVGIGNKAPDVINTSLTLTKAPNLGGNLTASFQ